jgi:hypothetical protein
MNMKRFFAFASYGCEPLYSATLRQPQCREDISETVSQQLVQKNGAYQQKKELAYPTVGYVPSTDGGHITLAYIILAVGNSSFQKQNSKLRQVIEQVRSGPAKYNIKDIL